MTSVSTCELIGTCINTSQFAASIVPQIRVILEGSDLTKVCVGFILLTHLKSPHLLIAVLRKL